MIRHGGKRVIFLLLAVLGIGCGTENKDEVLPGPAAAATATDTVAPFTREGLEVQREMTLLQQRTPPSLELKPGTTAWRAMERSDQQAVSDSTRHTLPGAFLSALVLSLGWPDALGDAVWEQTIRVWSESDDSAVGVVLQWGMQDDAVAGRDLRVQLRLVNGIWHAEKLEERFHCRRAVSADGVCS